MQDNAELDRAFDQASHWLGPPVPSLRLGHFYSHGPNESRFNRDGVHQIGPSWRECPARTTHGDGPLVHRLDTRPDASGSELEGEMSSFVAELEQLCRQIEDKHTITSTNIGKGRARARVANGRRLFILHSYTFICAGAFVHRGMQRC